MRPINTKAKDKARDNVERMVAATKRLEALLADPGPGIIVRRLPPAQNDDTPPLTAAPPIAEPAEEAPEQAPATPILTPPAAKPLSEASASELEQSKPEPVASEAPAIVARPAVTADVSPSVAESRTPEPVTAPMPPLSVATVAPQSQEAAKPAAEARPRPEQSPQAPTATASRAPSRRPSGSTEQREAAKPAVSHVVPRAETVKPAAAPALAETKPVAPPAAPARAEATPATARAAPSMETATPSAPVRAEAKPGAAPAKAKAAPEPAHDLPAPPAPKPLNAKPAPAAGTAAAARANHGFVGGLIDWLMPGTSDLKSAVALSGRAFAAAGVFSFVINVLMLAGPLFMLQVYDRVMSSGSLPTLISLFAITVGLYGIIGMLELSRSRVIVRIGVEVDQRLGERIFRASLKRSLASPGAAIPALRELDNIRQFVSGQGPMTFFDAPWTPVYLLVIFLVHWVLGVAALIGAVLLIAIAWASESHSREPLKQSGKASMRSLELADTGQRNAESITAMGMIGSYLVRWQRANGEALAWQTLAADRLGGMAALSKTMRLILQSAMLGIGAALAVKGEISSGSIIAGTIIFGRALAPVEQAISHWRAFLKARESYAKLTELLSSVPPQESKTALPAPKGRLEVASLRVAAPDTRALILANVNFKVEPGQMLAVIGPSASGKSTLVRTLVGLWTPISGSIQLDSARLDQWDAEALGRHIGYLPQNVELFSGTVKENISRFTDGASDAEIIAAAQMAHAHDMVLALPKGYHTELGNFGTYLSAGQRQRIGLARALFGNPALVVLDEPNANLDRSGDEALSSAVDGMRKRGQAVVLVSHRVQAIGKADLLLYLDRGVQRAFGPRGEVMKLLQQGSASA